MFGFIQHSVPRAPTPAQISVPEKKFGGWGDSTFHSSQLSRIVRSGNKAGPRRYYGLHHNVYGKRKVQLKSFGLGK